MRVMKVQRSASYVGCGTPAGRCPQSPSHTTNITRSPANVANFGPYRPATPGSTDRSTSHGTSQITGSERSFFRAGELG